MCQLAEGTGPAVNLNTFLDPQDLGASALIVSEAVEYTPLLIGHYPVNLLLPQQIEGFMKNSKKELEWNY